MEWDKPHALIIYFSRILDPSRHIYYFIILRKINLLKKKKKEFVQREWKYPNSLVCLKKLSG